jgi:hypothetical protein
MENLNQGMQSTVSADSPEYQPTVQPVENIPKYKSSQPVLLYIIILLLLVIAGFLGYEVLTLKKSAPVVSDNQSPVTIPSVLPTVLADPMEGWISYLIPQVNLAFKLPPSVNPTGKLDFTASQNNLFWNDNPDSIVRLWAVSPKSTFEGSFSYLNGCVGYKQTATGYKFLAYTRSETDIPKGLAKEITNASGISYLIVRSDPGIPAGSMPPVGSAEKGTVGALIKTDNSGYPILVIQMKLSAENSEALFEQILSGVNYNDGKSTFPADAQSGPAGYPIKNIVDQINRKLNTAYVPVVSADRKSVSVDLSGSSLDKISVSAIRDAIRETGLIYVPEQSGEAGANWTENYGKNADSCDLVSDGSKLTLTCHN